MTTLARGVTYLVAQFVRIVLKIFTSNLPDRIKFFLDDVRVKKPKTTYNNKKLALGMRRYMVEHIQNLDKVLADLERAGVTIAGAKSQFCRTGINIVRYICDADGHFPDKSKVLKIIDWPECTDTTSAGAFIGVCVHYQIWIKNFAPVASPIYHLFKESTLFILGKEQVKAMDLLNLALTGPRALISLDYLGETGEIILAMDAS